MRGPPKPSGINILKFVAIQWSEFSKKYDKSVPGGIHHNNRLEIFLNELYYCKLNIVDLLRCRRLARGVRKPHGIYFKSMEVRRFTTAVLAFPFARFVAFDLPNRKSGKNVSRILLIFRSLRQNCRNFHDVELKHVLLSDNHYSFFKSITPPPAGWNTYFQNALKPNPMDFI